MEEYFTRANVDVPNHNFKHAVAVAGADAERAPDVIGRRSTHAREHSPSRTQEITQLR